MLQKKDEIKKLKIVLICSSRNRSNWNRTPSRIGDFQRTNQNGHGYAKSENAAGKAREQCRDTSAKWI